MIHRISATYWVCEQIWLALRFSNFYVWITVTTGLRLSRMERREKRSSGNVLILAYHPLPLFLRAGRGIKDLISTRNLHFRRLYFYFRLDHVESKTEATYWDNMKINIDDEKRTLWLHWESIYATDLNVLRSDSSIISFISLQTTKNELRNNKKYKERYLESVLNLRSWERESLGFKHWVYRVCIT